jgi:hypothetical protein
MFPDNMDFIEPDDSDTDRFFSLDEPEQETFETEPDAGDEWETDYSEDDLIPISDNRAEIVKHSNLLATLIGKHREKKFQKKTLAEQENLIFMEMLDHKLPKETVQMVRNAMKKNEKFSRLELYKLVAGGAKNAELSTFCQMAVLSDGV